MLWQQVTMPEYEVLNIRGLLFSENKMLQSLGKCSCQWCQARICSSQAALVFLPWPQSWCPQPLHLQHGTHYSRGSIIFRRSLHPRTLTSIPTGQEWGAGCALAPGKGGKRWVWLFSLHSDRQALLAGARVGEWLLDRPLPVSSVDEVSCLDSEFTLASSADVLVRILEEGTSNTCP